MRLNVALVSLALVLAPVATSLAQSTPVPPAARSYIFRRDHRELCRFAREALAGSEISPLVRERLTRIVRNQCRPGIEPALR